MPAKNKVHLYVHRDRNKWFYLGRGKYRIQLCGHTDMGGFWIEQYANKLGKKDFMKDLTEILHHMEKDNKAPFTLYELE